MPENQNNGQSAMDAMRSELASLREQLDKMLKNADQKGHELASDMAHKIAVEIENCRHKASRRAEELRAAGMEGIGEVEAQVRKNPLASLLIAFGAGWLISCLFRHLR